MIPPVVIDLTYVAARLGAATPTGIERVDAAFACHFTAAAADQRGPWDAAAVHYGLRTPHLMVAGTARALVSEAEAAWQPPGGLADDPLYAAVARWLQGPPVPLRLAPPPARAGRQAALRRLSWRLAHDRKAVLPQGAVYLNVAQYGFEYPSLFRWLERRPDVAAVFFVHDMLPLDHPEFFRDGYRTLFDRRAATMARFARAAIVSGHEVGARVVAEMERRGRPGFPIFTSPLPPPAPPPGDPTPADPAAAPYFLVVGTIEPRKNHLLVLQAWRTLAAASGPVPRLVLVGPRGWENEQVVDLLDRSTAIRPHVAEVSGLSTPGLARLMAGARAVLVPSFAEGYGLPIAEALAMRTPVVASDIPVFRAVSQRCARLLDPTDGPAWRSTVAAFADPGSPARAEGVAAARRYRAPAWPDYFESLRAFLADLVRSPTPAP